MATTTETKIATETEDEDTEGEKKIDKITLLACSMFMRARSYQVLTVGQSQKSPALGVRKRDFSSTSVETSKQEKNR